MVTHHGLVAITDKDRKILWGRAANRCARCRCELVAERTETDREVVLGDEAHIAARSERGPRFHDLAQGVEVDSYENLILLCRNDHKQVDDQSYHFTAERLRSMKVEHEGWVSRALSHRDGGRVITLHEMRSGSDLWRLLGGSHGYVLQGPDDGQATADMVDVADDFLQLCRDYGEIHFDIAQEGIRAVRKAQRHLDDELGDLKKMQLSVVGATYQHRMKIAAPDLTFTVAVVRVVSDADSENNEASLRGPLSS